MHGQGDGGGGGSRTPVPESASFDATSTSSSPYSDSTDKASSTWSGEWSVGQRVQPDVRDAGEPMCTPPEEGQTADRINGTGSSAAECPSSPGCVVAGAFRYPANAGGAQDLRRLMAAWPGLPDSVRRGLADLAEASGARPAAEDVGPAGSTRSAQSKREGSSSRTERGAAAAPQEQPKSPGTTRHPRESPESGNA